MEEGQAFCSSVQSAPSGVPQGILGTSEGHKNHPGCQMGFYEAIARLQCEVCLDVSVHTLWERMARLGD